jgi:putative ABC transport system permease protein
MRGLGHLLRLLGLRHLRETPAQTLRATAAVMVAVGAMLSSQLVGRAITRGVSESLDAFTGRTALRLEAGETGLPESLLDAVRHVPGVDVAVPVLESPAYVNGSAGEVLTVLGLDIIEEGRVRRYASADGAEEVVEDPLVFLSQPSSIVLTRSWADRHGLRLDDPLVLQTPLGKRTFVVRGLLRPEGAALAFGGTIAIMDYQAAELAFAKRDRVDEIDVAATPGTDLDALATALHAVATPGVRVESPGAIAGELVLATRSVGFVMWLLSALVVLVAMFLLYNVVAMTVARHGQEIALLRTVGVRAVDTVHLFLLEAGVVGLAGALAGIVFGLALARVMLAPTGRTLGTALFRSIVPGEIGWIAPVDVLRAIAFGVGTTLAAAWLPARQATRFVPVVAARRGAASALRQVRLPSPWWGATCLGVGLAGVATARIWDVGAGAPAADAAFILAFALFAPALVRLLLPALDLLARPLGTVGRLAVLNVGSNVHRSALTATPLMVAVALVVVVATMAQSFRSSLDRWIAGFARQDLQIASVSQEPGRGQLFADSFAALVADVSGVARVHRFRLVHAGFEGARIGIEWLDYDPYDPELGNVRFRRGDPATAFARLASGDAIVVSENFAEHFHVGPGDVVRLPTPRGVRSLEIAATATNFNADQGSIMMARRLFVELFADDRVDYVLAELAPGAEADAVRAAIMARYGEQHALVILTNAELRRDILARIDRAFVPLSALFFLAILVGCLGIANSLQVAMSERVHEVGLLRTLGARRRDVGRVVVTEATMLGLVGVLLGSGLGALLSYVWVAVHVRHLLGWIIEYHFALRGSLAGVAAALVTVPIAAWPPARRAAAATPVEALAQG